jgi:valyl-tRNA synthetase
MFDENELKVSKRFMTKLWNAAKFSMMMIGDFESFDPNKVGLYDKWIIDKYHHTVKQAKFYLDKYEVGLARQEIDDFFWKDFCDNYLEYVKDRLYKTDLYDDERVESGKQTLYYTMLGILKLYSIYTPYITEEIYQNYFINHQDSMSIHLTTWDDGLIEDSGLQLCDAIKEILFETRKYKSERSLSMKEPLTNLKIGSPLADLIKLCLPDLTACTHAENIVVLLDHDSSIEIALE